MKEEWGPLLTGPVILAGTLFAFLAAWFWAYGHMSWLIIKGRKPSWWLDDPNKPDVSYKAYHVYIGKGVAWFFNIFWMWQMFRQPSCGTWVKQACQPVIDHIALLDIGAITFQLLLFFILISFYRWSTREK